MNKYPYIPLYTTSYKSATMNLSMEESGCYMQILLTMWEYEGSLPLDLHILGSICRMSRTRFIKVWEKLQSFFIIKDGRIFSKKLLKELEKNKEISQKNSENSKKNFKNLPSKSLINNNLHQPTDKPIEENRKEYNNHQPISSTLEVFVGGGLVNKNNFEENKNLSYPKNKDNCLQNVEGSGRLDEFIAKAFEACGDNRPKSINGAVEILNLIESGYSESAILAVIKAETSKGRKINTFSYFLTAIKRDCKAVSNMQPVSTRTHEKISPFMHRYRARDYRYGVTWKNEWGIPPHHHEFILPDGVTWKDYGLEYKKERQFA